MSIQLLCLWPERVLDEVVLHGRGLQHRWDRWQRLVLVCTVAGKFFQRALGLVVPNGLADTEGAVRSRDKPGTLKDV